MHVRHRGQPCQQKIAVLPGYTGCTKAMLIRSQVTKDAQLRPYRQKPFLCSQSSHSCSYFAAFSASTSSLKLSVFISQPAANKTDRGCNLRRVCLILKENKRYGKAASENELTPRCHYSSAATKQSVVLLRECRNITTCRGQQKGFMKVHFSSAC